MMSDTLKILLVDRMESRADELRALLCRCGYAVHRMQGAPSLIDEVVRLKPDVMIVDMVSAEHAVLGHLREVTERAPLPIILRTEVDDPAFIDEAISVGVSSLHAGAVQPASINAIVTAAIALFRRHRRSEEERQSAVAALEERRILEQAKAILIRRRGMSEPEAYRWLRSKAMRESRKIGIVAAELLRGQEA